MGTVGLFLCVLSIVVIFYLESKGAWSDDNPLPLIVSFGLGFGLIILAKCIQKLWNIEFYLEQLANNSHQSDYNPFSKERKPQQDKPSNPESDMSKYAPK